MSEGESKQVPSGGSDSKPESASSGPGMTSVSAPVTSAAPPEEEEEEESEDESEILEESPCGRWQKRREEVGAGGRFLGLGCRGAGCGTPAGSRPAPLSVPLGPPRPRWRGRSRSWGGRGVASPPRAVGLTLLGLENVEARAWPAFLPARSLCWRLRPADGVRASCCCCVSRECLQRSYVHLTSQVFCAGHNEEQRLDSSWRWLGSVK